MAKTQKRHEKREATGSDVARRRAGPFKGIKIVDPVVKPKSATVREIRLAVEKARSKHR
jgi:hypothetical protein